MVFQSVSATVFVAQQPARQPGIDVSAGFALLIGRLLDHCEENVVIQIRCAEQSCNDRTVTIDRWSAGRRRGVMQDKAGAALFGKAPVCT